MPFKSQAQKGFMYAKKPKLAKEFQEATKKGVNLPSRVGLAPPTRNRLYG